uniref:proliferation marker protein Ki-67 isoform X2 n=1 Tax=Arvicanthis niloticus TaxID=61156 RepID=UPI001485F455|nr:proliferation marker protein Ki-67 isoform X2 [Arvicanthis niloticus]
MASSARLVTIKRSGEDGAHFPLSLSSCLFGRSIECDIRIQLPVVSKKHCRIEVKEEEAILYNFSSTNPTKVNGATVDEPVQLRHGDIITIIDRSFRFEGGSHEDGSRSTEFPGKSLGKEPARRASRDSFCADPDGKGQDTKASKMTTSRRSFVHAKGLSADSPASDGSKDSVTQDSSEHVEWHNRRNIGEPTSGDLFKKSRATASSYRELKSSPAQRLSNSNKNESPFEKLYQSMKEELDVKSQKSRRKSEPRSDHAAEESWKTRLLVSGKARPKSSGSTPLTAASSPKVGKIWTERWGGDMGPVQTSTEAAKMKTPVQNSEQLKDEDSCVTGRRNSVNLDENESAQAVHKIVTPGKLVTRNQTAVKVGDVASPADTPENGSSKKRRRIPANVEAASAETQKQLSLTQGLALNEKKSPKNSFSKPEKLATAAEQTSSAIPGLSSIDMSNFGDSINKNEGMPLKRRRVSFGGHLRPELFDENLPPNTPLKRGETPTKRKSLGSHSPAVLKKIIKERPQSPGKQESPGVTPPRTNDQRRRSGRTSLASSGSKFLNETDIPKKGGRKSGNLPAKRTSISRSQHGILQMICSKRRSGASEANLIVAKSWADVVKLGVKQTQMKVVKHVPQKQASKRQKRPSTPKKPTSNLYNQFTTGHANSPCTIVVGRAQIEKVSVPARPYKMLNNLMLNRKIDFSEDLSGLTEMFKTPVKEKQQQMSDMGSILSNLENLSERPSQVTNSGDTPLPITAEILGEKVFSSTQNVVKQQSDRYSASPTLRRRSIKHENTVETPKNVHNITPLEKKTPVSETEPLKTASMSKLRRSRELRHTLVESMNEKTETVLAERITGRHLRKTFQGQEMDQQVQDSENSSQRCKENGELSESSEKASARRSSARKQKPTKDLIVSQMVTQTADCAEELLGQEQGTIQNLEESMHMQNTSISDDQGITKQKMNIAVYATKEKHWPKTPAKTTQPLEGPADLKEHFETPNRKDELIGDDKIKVLCRSPQPTAENIKTSTKPWTSTSGKKVDMKEELSALTKLIHMSGETRHTSKVLELEHGDIKALKQSENEVLAPTITGSKRTLQRAKEKAQALEDLTGFQELFLSPDPGVKITKMPHKSSHTEPVRTPASTKRLSKTGLKKVDVKGEPSTLGKRKKSLGRAAGTPAPEQGENDNTAFMETPKQKLDFTGNSTGHKRRSQTPKIKTQPLEDLDGFQELFQTPAGASDPVSVEKSAKMSLESSRAEPIRTPASTKRLSKTGLSKMDVREEPSTPGKRTKSPGRAAGTPAPVQGENDNTAFMETPKQKLDFTGNSTGHKRRSQTPKIRTQPLEDLDGFQELFQTPAGASDPVSVEKSAKISLESSQAEPIRTPASTKRLSKTGLSKMDVREEPSTPGKRTKSPGRATGTPAPVQGENDTTTFMQTPKQKLESAGDLTGHRKQSRTPKAKAQYLEDITVFQELFQTPDHANGPLAVDKTKKMSCNSSQPESAITLKNIERQSRASMSKMDVKGELLESEEHLQLGEGIDTLKIPKDKVIRSPRKPAKRKLDPTSRMPGSKRMRYSSKDNTTCLEDLSGFQQLFQMPAYAKDSLTIETSTILTRSPQPGPVRTQINRKSLPKISLRKVDMTEDLSVVSKQSLGRACTAPVQEDNKFKTIMETPKETLKTAADRTGLTRQPQTPKEKVQPLEDYGGFQELFQTPRYSSHPLIGNKRTRMSLKSPQPGFARIPQTSKRLAKTSVGNVDVKEMLSPLNGPQPATGEVVHIPIGPEENDRGNKGVKECIPQTLGSSGSRTVRQKHRGTHEERSQFSGDLFYLPELFQTPASGKDPVTVGETTKMTLQSSQPGYIRTPASTKRLPKTSLVKVDMRELSILEKQTQSRGGAKCTPASVQEENDNTAFMETPKQKQDFAENSAGSKRRSKIRTQPLEDLDGFQELFQTPAGTSDPVSVEKSAKMSLESSRAEPVRTPASTKRLSKTGLSKMDVREEPSTPGKRTKSPGRAAGTPAPVQGENDNTAFMETPKQKLDFTGNSTGHKRRSQTPKIRTQPLEDLDGFQELFQTPAGASDPVSVEKSAKMSLESSRAEPVRTPASTKRLSKTGLSKMDVREEPSTPGKRTKSPGRAAGTPAPVQGENDNTAFMETPKQKQDFAENSAGSKRRSKIRTQPLEDLDGFQELFQTPAATSDPVSVEKSAKMSLESSQVEPIRTPASTKRLSKTDLSKMDMRGALSPLSKPMCASQKVMHTSTFSEDHGRETKDVKVLLAETFDPAVHVTHSKRQQGLCKKRSQSPEDLFGLQELFQTPGHNKDSVTLDNLAKLPCRSPPPEPIDTSVASRRQPRTGLRKVHVKNELSGDIMHPQMSGDIVDLPRQPEGEDKVIKTRKQSVKRKLDTAVNVPGSKRQRITRAEKTLEDLPGFQELCQASGLVMDSVIVDKTTKMHSKSPEPVDTTLETQPRRQLRRRLGVTEEPMSQRKTTRVVRQTRNTHKEPEDDSKCIEEFKESSAQKEDPAISLTGRRNQPRTVKENTQPLEELTSSQKETATRMSCKSPKLEKKKTLAGLKRQVRIQLFKVSVKEEPTAQRKQPARETRSTLKEPVGDSINVEELKKSTKQKIDPVASMPVSKRPRRVPKEKAQTLEFPGLKGPIQTLGHTEESASDEGPTQMPCNSLQPEQVDSLQTSPRHLRTRHGKVEADKEPSAIRKTVQTSRQTMRSCKVPKIDDNGTQASKAPVKQTVDIVAKVTGSRRRLRTHKDGVQPLEVLGDSKEQISDHSEKLRHDTNILKSTLQQEPDSVKPLRTCRRVLRASKEDPKEVLVDTRDPAALQSKNNPLLCPKRKSARDGIILRTRALRSVTPKQEATDEKPVPKKQRAASSKRHVSPEPVKMKHLRIMSNKLDSVEEQVSTITKTEEMEAKRENPVTPDQSSRYRKKTSEKRPRPTLDASAEKVGIKKNEKTMKTASQETELQNPDAGTKTSTSRGKVSGKRTCLRSRGQTEIPQPREAEDKTSKSGAEILTQKEKGVSGDSDVRCLRSRKTKVTLDSEPKPRVTQGAKKDAKTLKKDEDIVYTKKLRTRSHQKS